MSNSSINQNTLKGYIIIKKIQNTLQGCIFVAQNIKTKSKVVIKIISVMLLSKGISLSNNNNKTRKCLENIVTEAEIMQYLQQKKPPKGFIDWIDFFKDDDFYYLIMNYGGKSIFNYIKKSITLIEYKKMSTEIWKLHIKKLFKQMCYYIKWLHQNNVCHLDISLENCLIDNNVVSFCDFGVAIKFKNSKDAIKCNKYAGKTPYQSPEVYKKTNFDGKKADIWSLGVVLFAMHTGSLIYKKPSNSDARYTNLMNGLLKQMVISWGIHGSIDDDCYDLLSNIFITEEKRYNINDILNHKFIKNIRMY